MEFPDQFYWEIVHLLIESKNGPSLLEWISALGPIIATIIAGIAAVAAIGNFWIARNRHTAQTDADRERRITESFSKATEQLGSKEMAIRLGGIFTFERILRESNKDYWQVMEILTAFIRMKSPWPYEEMYEPPLSREKVMEIQIRDIIYHTRSCGIDIQAAITVIGSNNNTKNRSKILNSGMLDLTGTDLHGIKFDGLNYDLVNFSLSNLDRASFKNSSVKSSRFHLSRMKNSWFTDADLQNSSFILWLVEITNLDRANLRGCTFMIPEDGDIRNSKEHFSSAYGDENTRIPDCLRPDTWPPYKETS